MTRRQAAGALCVSVACASLSGGPQAQAPVSTPAPTLASGPVTRDYPYRPVPFTSVQLTDTFWRPRIETNRTVTIPFAFEQCELNGRMDNFARAAAALRGEALSNRKPPAYPFDDTDPYKVIEGAAYTLSVHPDPTLEAYIDGLVDTIAAAQERDGYLYTTRSIDPKQPHPWAGPSRWVLEKDDSHELYNLGHLYEAAVAYHQATGKRRLLDVALRTADLLVATFGPGKQSIWPGHQITEMGLVKLYRVTGERKYLELAQFMLDERGPDGDQGAGREYNQSHLRVVDQSDAVGHAVRATYMYSGMADVAALTGNAAYLEASNRLWQSVVTGKLYITGGIGATGRGEAFGHAFELPNMTAYNETCAAIGNDYWNHRLFLLHGDAKYIDVMERTLYNGLVSGVSRDGKAFFYPNPLESAGQHARSPWFGVACCPSNITRFLASVPGYLYAVRDDTIHVNLFADSTARIALDGRTVAVEQQTRYPWEGRVSLRVREAGDRPLALRLRVPGWAREEPVPGGLYRFATPVSEVPTLEVNGQSVPLTLDRGYVEVRRSWADGDEVVLDLPMPVRRVLADDRVEADRNRVALQRGPIVFAAEWPDNDGRVRNLVVPDDVPLETRFEPDLLGGVQVVRGPARAHALEADGRRIVRDVVLTAIPYHAWANRGRGEMIVWLARDAAVVRPAPFPTPAMRGTVTTSGRKYPGAINDGEAPARSDDPTYYFDWWPTKNSTEWVELALPERQRVSAVDVFWFDDTGRGQVRVPASWRVLYRATDGAWAAVSSPDVPGVARDRFNTLTFDPVDTDALRLEVTMQPEWSAGVQEWQIR